ncbi:hypothetical protein FIBSPDRAFT_886017 [Athelia psychrophila]|uniref:Uncharacterized protein n=1 Tax=Athelia psychrophila TaxID=1759441 RepID=A0A166RCT5_9AGAM|nr:hypothetical protein FIBSPDRAFT_886017 [Fibularhizoctonia sp. CBS 109695]
MFQPQPQPSLLPDDLWGMDLFQFVTSIVLPIQDPVLQTHLDFCDLVVRAEVSARQMLQGEPQIILSGRPAMADAHMYDWISDLVEWENGRIPRLKLGAICRSFRRYHECHNGWLRWSHLKVVPSME